MNDSQISMMENQAAAIAKDALDSGDLMVRQLADDTLALIAEVRRLRTKLDAVPVNWEDAPRWAQWWAVDCDGEAYWFECEPVRCSSVWNSSAGGMSRMLAYGYVDVDNVNWRTSLQQRPQEVQP